MRVLKGLLLAVTAFCMLSSTAHAAVITDDCDSLMSAFAKYNNLGPVNPNPLTRFQPDTSYLTVVSPTIPASAEYSIQGAQTIRVEIYSQMGTFASLRTDGHYTIGLQNDNMPSQNKYRTHYCEQKKSVFLHLGTQSSILSKTSGSLGYYYFQELTEASELNCSHSHDEYMGVNISTSVDGEHFFPLPIPPTLTNVEVYRNNDTIGYYREQYDAVLPAGAKYIRVVLRDFTQYAMGTVIKQLNTPSRLYLAKVSFTVPDTQGGEQPSSAPETSSSSEQTTGGGTGNNNTSSKKKDKSALSSSSSSKAASKSSSMSGSSSKAAAVTNKRSSESLSESRSSSAPQEGFESFDEATPAMATVEVPGPAPREKNNWKTTVMVVVYTVSAVGIIGRLIYKLF